MSTKDRIQIVGQLVDHAQVAMIQGTNPPAFALYLRLQPEKAGSLPYLVAQHLGTDPKAELAGRAKAQLLRRGAWAQVYGTHLRYRADHDVPALRVEGVTDIHPYDQPAMFTEATHTESPDALS